jgi:hypothetical protein
MSNVEKFTEQLVNLQFLAPRKAKDNKTRVAKPAYTRQVVTIVGVKTVQTRFLPVSHDGHSNETYVDKVDLLGKQRAEFIGRKLKGIERRAHMAMFREMVERVNTGSDWQSFFVNHFDKACTIPDNLCIACWNCSLFGGLEAGKGATFSRIRYFDTYSVEDGLDCIATESSENGMGIGNQVYEDVNQARGSDTFHLYEYVKSGTRFPFITIIESPTLLDVAGMIHAIRRADSHGYGKYSANHGKFATQFLTVAIGYPRFSVLDMLEWAEKSSFLDHFKAGGVKFDSLGDSVALFENEIEEIAGKLQDAYCSYNQFLG